MPQTLSDGALRGSSLLEWWVEEFGAEEGVEVAAAMEAFWVSGKIWDPSGSLVERLFCCFVFSPFLYAEDFLQFWPLVLWFFEGASFVGILSY